MNVSYLVHVSGKVQGVYFRASSQQQAIEHGISGYARNLSDGDVELLICGDNNNVNIMLEWLKKGPSMARVDKVDIKQVEWQYHDFFSIG
ncbi:acylphosphatase [Thalassotalea profundi]|uniref:Acylphosphatase n=1 Tax=Thalassotalea profundi TaxID=2036687 RepID=A0ABQ3IQ78_9GAMM|nr:acylphosphatase [Thalassotalea profundi]GHE91176.1 acylphosphatase [Thalassotalea profundi]